MEGRPFAPYAVADFYSDTLTIDNRILHQNGMLAILFAAASLFASGLANVASGNLNHSGVDPTIRDADWGEMGIIAGVNSIVHALASWKGTL
jgi:hypothetical protein